MLPVGRTLRARRFAPVYLAPLGSIDDIQRAVADKATKPIFYESRIAKLARVFAPYHEFLSDRFRPLN